jgi:hypothetical protein
MQVRVQPVGVRVRFSYPSPLAGLELAYSANTQPTKVRYRPAGSEGLKGFRLVAIDDPDLLNQHRYPLPEWTLGALLQRISAALERERGLRNPVEVFRADYRFAQRDVTRYEIHLRRPHAFRPAARMLLYFDKQNKLLLRYEAYASVSPSQQPNADLMEMFSYTDLRTNVGLTEQTFCD